MAPHEKLALSVEGMRGGHFSGTRHRGDMRLVDEGDRLTMIMQRCGSGGVLRGGDPETGRSAYPVAEHGTNKEPHLWTCTETPGETRFFALFSAVRLSRQSREARSGYASSATFSAYPLRMTTAGLL